MIIRLRLSSKIFSSGVSREPVTTHRVKTAWLPLCWNALSHLRHGGSFYIFPTENLTYSTIRKYWTEPMRLTKWYGAYLLFAALLFKAQSFCFQSQLLFLVSFLFPENVTAIIQIYVRERFQQPKLLKVDNHPPPCKNLKVFFKITFHKKRINTQILE